MDWSSSPTAVTFASSDAISRSHLYWIVLVSWNSSIRIDWNLDWKKVLTEGEATSISYDFKRSSPKSTRSSFLQTFSYSLYILLTVSV